MNKIKQFLLSDLALDIAVGALMTAVLLIVCVVVMFFLLLLVIAGHGLYWVGVLCLWAAMTAYVRKARDED